MDIGWGGGFWENLNFLNLYCKIIENMFWILFYLIKLKYFKRFGYILDKNLDLCI